MNQVIPYKIKGPNPAKFSNCMSRFLYDSDSILKSSILLLLQYGKVQVGSLLKWASRPFRVVHATKWLGCFLQNDP